LTILIGDGKGGGGPMEVRENRGQVDAQVETVFFLIEGPPDPIVLATRLSVLI